MLLRPVGYEGGFQRPLQGNDLLVDGTTFGVATDTTNTNLTITAAMLLQGLIVRNPAGVSNENYESAANIVAAIGQGNAVQNGTAFRYRVINLSANLLIGVFTANTGLTGTRGSVAASTTKDFACVITNGTPAVSISGTTTNGSAVLSNVAASVFATVSVGMIVLNAVANLQGQTIIGMNPSAGTITFSGNANATANNQVLNMSPTVSIIGLAA